MAGRRFRSCRSGRALAVASGRVASHGGWRPPASGRGSVAEADRAGTRRRPLRGDDMLM
jgi:hypothetical protein